VRRSTGSVPHLRRVPSVGSREPYNTYLTPFGPEALIQGRGGDSGALARWQRRGGSECNERVGGGGRSKCSERLLIRLAP
jgi:hypothetical protein